VNTFFSRLREIVAEGGTREDSQPCGKSFIADKLKCSKPVSAIPKRNQEIHARRSAAVSRLKAQSQAAGIKRPVNYTKGQIAAEVKAARSPAAVKAGGGGLAGPRINPATAELKGFGRVDPDDFSRGEYESLRDRDDNTARNYKKDWYPREQESSFDVLARNRDSALDGTSSKTKAERDAAQEVYNSLNKKYAKRREELTYEEAIAGFPKMKERVLSSPMLPSQKGIIDAVARGKAKKDATDMELDVLAGREWVKNASNDSLKKSFGSLEEFRHRFKQRVKGTEPEGEKGFEGLMPRDKDKVRETSEYQKLNKKLEQLRGSDKNTYWQEKNVQRQIDELSRSVLGEAKRKASVPAEGTVPTPATAPAEGTTASLTANKRYFAMSGKQLKDELRNRGETPYNNGKALDNRGMAQKLEALDKRREQGQERPAAKLASEVLKEAGAGGAAKVLDTLPMGVQNTVRYNSGILANAEAALAAGRQLDKTLNGGGRYEAESWEKNAEMVEYAKERLANFSKLAKAKGLDPDAIIAETGAPRDAKPTAAGASYYADLQSAKAQRAAEDAKQAQQSATASQGSKGKWDAAVNKTYDDEAAASSQLEAIDKKWQNVSSPRPFNRPFGTRGRTREEWHVEMPGGQKRVFQDKKAANQHIQEEWQMERLGAQKKITDAAGKRAELIKNGPTPAAGTTPTNPARPQTIADQDARNAALANFTPPKNRTRSTKTPDQKGKVLTTAKVDITQPDQRAAFNQQEMERARRRAKDPNATPAQRQAAAADAIKWEAEAKKSRLAAVNAERKRVTTSQTELFGVETGSSLPLFAQPAAASVPASPKATGGKMRSGVDYSDLAATSNKKAERINARTVMTDPVVADIANKSGFDIPKSDWKKIAKAAGARNYEEFRDALEFMDLDRQQKYDGKAVTPRGGAAIMSLFQKVQSWRQPNGKLDNRAPKELWDIEEGRLDSVSAISPYRLDRLLKGGEFSARKASGPASTRSKPKCSPRSQECGNTCIPLTKDCTSDDLGTASKRLKLLKQSGGDDIRVQRLKRMINAKAQPRREELAKAQAARARANQGSAPGISSTGLATLDPKTIKVDPKRFQYKLIGEHTASGEVGSLSGVQKWDPNLGGVLQVWKDPADGGTYVVNGHNRLALAKRAGAQAVDARFLNVPNAKAARSVGALTNIAEGRGTALDAAKFFRDSGLTRSDLQSRGIPMREAIAQDGLNLSNLDDSIFRKTIDGNLSISRASIIGGAGLEPTQQRDLVKLIERDGKRRNLTDGAIAELADAAKASSTNSQQTMSLFGMEEVQQSNLIERAQLQASIKRRLAREKKLFGTVANASAAEDLGRAGNQINRETSGAISQQAAIALGTFDQLKNLSGPVSDALNAAATRVSKGESARAVERDAYQAVLEAVQSVYRPRSAAA
jgi:hypothetical protein